MAKHVDPGTPRHGAPVHDGRFGVTFDEEISSRGVLLTIAGVGVTMVIAFALMWFFWLYLEGSRERPDIAPTPRMMAEAKKVAIPSLSPRLQADPEGELVIMRRELAKRLNGYGWVDEGNDVVHIPVDQAMALVLERGLPATGQAIALGADDAASMDAETPAEPTDLAGTGVDGTDLDATSDDHADPTTGDHADTESADGAHSS